MIMHGIKWKCKGPFQVTDISEFGQGIIYGNGQMAYSSD